jgi:hypothetical protein
MMSPRRRLTLRAGVFWIAASAVVLAFVVQFSKSRRQVAHQFFSIAGGDAESCARDLLSDAILDGALHDPHPLGPPLVATPRFSGVNDPREVLRRCLRVEIEPRFPDNIELTSDADPINEALEMVSAVAHSCMMRRGASRVSASGPPYAATRRHRDRDAVEMLVIYLAVVGLSIWAHLGWVKPRRMRAAFHARGWRYWRERANCSRMERIRAADEGDLDRVEDLGLVVRVCRDRSEWHADECRRAGGAWMCPTLAEGGSDGPGA